MKGAERFKELLTKYSNRPILLYGDPDLDGLISLLLMCQFCDMLGMRYSYYVNENRSHGFMLDYSKVKGYLVISADFAISENEMQNLVDNDVVVLSTDHHECQHSFIECTGLGEGIVINNQYPFEPEEDRYLSGAGVFYELIVSLYPEFKSKEREALVGVTLLSDIREIENDKARAYLKTAYTSDSSQGYINYLIENTLSSDYSFGVPRLDRNFIDFTLSPFINSLLRFNKTKEAVEFILGKGLANGSSCRGAQKDLVVLMTEKAKVLEMPNLIVIGINSLNLVEYHTSVLTSFIGLLCSDYKDKHGSKSTLGFVWDNGKVVRASFRGKFDDVPYNTSFRNLGIHTEGHKNAFGIIGLVPNDDLWVDLNDLVGDLEADHKPSYHIVESSNLAMTLSQKGMTMATENCYVRDMCRYYIKYLGNTYSINRVTYKVIEDNMNPEFMSKGVGYRYVYDGDGQKVPKYIEYSVNGRVVKSFGVSIEEGYIMPILEKGYIQLYLKKL